ncbi:hypothetical protein K2X05_13460 [bacterium]|nr:hypothetical protein [bacterium]
MFRWLPQFIFILMLVSCSSKESSQPPCQYTSTPQTVIKHSTTPERTGLPYQQEPLISLMWTPINDCECFVRKNGRIQIYKVPEEPINKTLTFQKLKNAPAKSISNWTESVEQINSNRSGHRSILWGLTTLFFQSLPKEKIAHTEILLREDSRPWHLWHEYSHYLIGISRSESPHMNLRKPSLEELSAAFDKALQQNDSDEFNKHFQKFSDLQMDFIQQEFVDEIVIEQTLQDLASQAKELLPVDNRDFQDSMDVVDRYNDKYRFYLMEQQQRFSQLSAELDQDRRGAIELHLRRLQQLETNLASVVF